MISLVSSQVRFRRTGSCARAFQKLVTLVVLREAMMSSYTARTAGLAFSYSMNPSVDMVKLSPSPISKRRDDSGGRKERCFQSWQLAFFPRAESPEPAPERLRYQQQLSRGLASFEVAVRLLCLFESISMSDAQLHFGAGDHAEHFTGALLELLAGD